MVIEEILIGLAIGVVILVHALLVVGLLGAAREDDDPVHILFYTIVAIILMIDPVVYAIAMRVTG